ncbi:TPA: EpsG family protein [Citrobacter freundii]
MKKNNLFASILLFINIPLAIPFIVKGVLNNDKNILFLIAIIMAILSYLSIPYTTMDLVRYYQLYDDISASYSIAINEIEGNLIVNSYLKLLIDMGLNRQFLPFMANFLSYFYLFKAIVYVLTKDGSGLKQNELLIFTFIVLFGVAFFFGASGIRTGVAVSLSLYGIARFDNKKYFSFSLYMFLAIMIHYMMLIVMMAVFFAVIFRNKNILRFICIISPFFAFIGVGELIVKAVFFAFSNTLQSYGLYRLSYIDGEWGTAFYGLRNLNTFIYEKFIYVLPFYFSYIYLFLVKRKSLYRDILYVLITMVFLFFDFRTLFMRYSYFSSLLFMLVLADEFNILKVTKKLSIIFLLMCVIYSAGSVYKYRDMFFPSWAKVIYQPTPLLFLNIVNDNDYIVREE